MDDEKLIILVQANECLYNKYCTGFKLPQKKKQAWQQIALEMRISEELCIKRWACLRDRYAREKRQANLPSGSGANIMSHWPLMQTMEFIAPHIVPRATRCSFNILNEFDTDTNSQPFPHSPEPSISPMLISSPLQIDSESSFSSLPSATTPAAQKRRKRHEAVDESGEFSEALNIFKNLCEKKMEEKEDEKSPLHGFGQMIVATIQTMSPAKQIRAMQKVTTLVMEMKLEPDTE